MLKWFRRKTINDVLEETCKVKIKGVVFKIRKVNVIDHMAGYKVFLQTFATYTSGQKKSDVTKTMLDVDPKKLREAMADTICAGCVDPVVSVKPDSPDGVFVDALFQDWEMANLLYGHIVAFSYGQKKNFSRGLLQKRGR